MDLSAAEKHKMVICLWQGIKTLNFSWKLECDHRTVKRFEVDSEHTWVHADKSTKRKVSVRQIHQIKRETAKWLYKTAKRDMKLLVQVLQTLRRCFSIRPPLNKALGTDIHDYLFLFYFFSLMSAVHLLIVQNDVVVDGWWMASMFQLGNNASKEAAQSMSVGGQFTSKQELWKLASDFNKYIFLMFKMFYYEFGTMHLQEQLSFGSVFKNI